MVFVIAAVLAIIAGVMSALERAWVMLLLCLAVAGIAIGLAGPLP